MLAVLYKTNPSPPARAVMMVADILNIKLDMRDLNPILRLQDTPEFTKKNPMRTIPILDEGDYCLADSHAIMLYLLDKYGTSTHSHLYPSELRKRATVNQRLFFDCGILFPRLRAVMDPTFSGQLTEISKNIVVNIEDAYRTMNAYLTETTYLADNVVTVADISAYATTSSLNGLHAVDVTKYPELKQWLINMSEKDYCKKRNEQLVDILKRKMEKNKLKQKSQAQI